MKTKRQDGIGAGARIARSASRRLRWAIVLAAGAAGSAAAFAADDNKIIFPSGAGHAAAPTASGGSVANTITLVLALLFAAAGAWVFLRNRRNATVSKDGRSLAVEETRSLGNRQYLVVASYEGRKFLLGVCPGRIDLLSPLNEPPKAESSRGGLAL